MPKLLYIKILKQLITTLNRNESEKKPLLHYYDERGNMVFTAEYHLERGYCCKNGCKHCPYDDIIADKDLHKEK